MVVDLNSSLVVLAACLVFGVWADGAVVADCDVVGVAEVLGEGVGLFV